MNAEKHLGIYAGDSLSPCAGERYCVYYYGSYFFDSKAQTLKLPIIQLKNEYLDKILLFQIGTKQVQNRLECENPKLKFKMKNSTRLDSQEVMEMVCLPTVWKF